MLTEVPGTGSTVAQHWLPRSAMSTRSKWWAAVDDIVERAASLWLQQGYSDSDSELRGGRGIGEPALERLLATLRPPLPEKHG
jgi:hypothetical protein